MNEDKTRSQAMVSQSDSRRSQPMRNDSTRSSNAMADSTGARTGDVRDRGSALTPAPDRHLEERRTEASQAIAESSRVESPLHQMHALIARSGEEGFSQNVIDVLSEPIMDGLVSIKPNGLLYVSHPHYRSRLDNAFGVGGWCLVPLDKPQIQGKRVVWYGFLKAGGRYIDAAYGGQDYFPNNNTMSLDDAVEGAKSDCLVRCCKSLPMFRELWDKEYIDYWKATYAQEVAMPDSRSGKGWRKLGEYTRKFNTKPGIESESAFRKPSRVEDENNAHLRAIAREAAGDSIGDYSDIPNDEFLDDARDD